MTTPVMTVKPLFVRWIKLSIVDKNNVTHEFECEVTQAGLTSTGGDPVAINTLCPEGSFAEATERTWQLVLTILQDVESADSLTFFLLQHDGEEATFTYYPKADKQHNPVGFGFTGTVTLGPPDNVGNAASGSYATATATLPLKGKYSIVDATGAPMLDKASASPGDVFPAEPTITASDVTNAAKLAGLGYVADPSTAWTTGQKMTVGTFDFSWDGAMWDPGAAL